MRRLLIRGARELLTVRGSNGSRRGAALNDLGLIQDGSVLVEDGVIRAVGVTRRIENLAVAASAEVIEARGRVLMPAFVDCHAHPIPAGLLEKAPAPRVKDSIARLLARACAHGTATFGAVGGSTADAELEAKAMRIYGALVDEPVQLVQSANANALGAGGLRKVAERGLARFATIACGLGQWGVEQSKALIGAAPEKLSVRLEFGAEGCEAPLASLLPERIHSVEHLEHATEADLDAVARWGLPAVLLPARAFFLDSGFYAQGRRLAEAGAPVALGSDSNDADAPGSSMQFAVWLACRRMGLSVAQAITAATVNAAYVVGLGHRTGSIEPGKQADLILLDTPDHRALAHEFGMNLIGMTLKSGKLVYQAAGLR